MINSYPLYTNVDNKPLTINYDSDSNKIFLEVDNKNKIEIFNVYKRRNIKDVLCSYMWNIANNYKFVYDEDIDVDNFQM